MDSKEIDALKGRKLDAMVARHYFGREVIQNRVREWGYPDGILPDSIHNEPIPYYSMGMEDAWPLVESLVSAGWEVDIYNHEGPERNWTVSLDRGNLVKSGETAPIAICRAVLEVAII